MNYPQPTPPVDREIQGVLSAVEPRQGGWHRFAIQEAGRQYPVKCDTKQVELIQQAMALLGQPVAVALREQEATPRPDGSHINPNNGRPWVNRYLNGIAPFGYAPGVQPTQQQHQQPPQQTGYQPQQQAQAPPQSQPQTAPMQAIEPGLMGHEKDINIMRQTAAKVVAMSWEVLPEDQRTPTGMVAACEVWMAYFIHGPLRFGVQPFGIIQPQSEMTMLSGMNGQQAGPGYDDPGSRFIELDGTFPCPECGHTNTHMSGCPAAVPSE